LRILPYRNKTRIDGVVLTLIDVSLLKQAEEDAREAVRRRDHFLAMLSHELRNPLGAVLNAAYLMEREGMDSAARRDALEVIVRQAQQMARLLDDLLDVSRITQNKIEIHRELLDLRTTATEAVQAVRPTLDARRQTLIVKIEPSPLVVMGDAARLQQIQVNLLHNSIKYTPPEGTIWLNIYRQDGEIVVRVRDTGEGIPPHMLESIFDLFVQNHKTLDRSDGGMGVGLTLVRTLVAMHGGTVTARSEGAGRGSEFVVRLPLAIAQEPATTPQRPSKPRAGRRVLIVEDNADSREMLAQILRLDGCHVTVAADGNQGLEAIRRERFDLAMVDIGLPGIDGYEVARQARTGAKGDGTYFVALTGYGRPEDRLAVLQAGFDEHLIKPVKPSDLDRVLRVCTGPDGNG
jgi:two-component system CheB/CheR fusion protein